MDTDIRKINTKKIIDHRGNGTAVYEKTCEACGNKYYPKKFDSRFCCNNCRAYYHRNKNKPDKLKMNTGGLLKNETTKEIEVEKEMPIISLKSIVSSEYKLNNLRIGSSVIIKENGYTYIYYLKNFEFDIDKIDIQESLFNNRESIVVELIYKEKETAENYKRVMINYQDVNFDRSIKPIIVSKPPPPTPSNIILKITMSELLELI